MGAAALVVIHASTIPWHRGFVQRMSDGLKRLGVTHKVVSERHRTSDDLAILLGTSAWRQVEATGPYLLVDRCSFGDTNHWVTLVRDGHGRRGDHRVPHGTPAYRWEWMEDVTGVRLLPWGSGRRRLLCGQTETYSPHYASLADWYGTVSATHFRKHPAGQNPTGLPELQTWNEVGQAITLNSSVAVEAVLHGVPTVTMDEAAMAWEVTSHTPAETVKPARLPWLHWLAWTQWNHEEISEGTPWQHLLS